MGAQDELPSTEAEAPDTTPEPDAHPVYDLPPQVGNREPAAADTPSTPETPAAATPGGAQPAAPVAAPAAPAAAPPALATAALTDDDLRKDPRVAHLLAQNDALTRALGQRQAPAAPAAPATPATPETPRDPKDVQLEESMLKRIPWLGQVRDFIQNQERLQAIDALAQVAPRFTSTLQQFADDTADRGASRAVELYALARGLDPKTIDRPTQANLLTTLVAHLQANPQLQARFQGGDIRVVDDVMTPILGMWGLQVPAQAPPPAAAAAPVTPPAAPAAPTVDVVPSAALAARVAGAGNLPRSGANALPPPASPVPPVADSADEDTVHAAGWQQLRAVVGAR